MQALIGEDRHETRAARGTQIVLWVLAVTLMMTAAVYQRLTGPTHRLRGSFTVAGQVYRYRLIRNELSTKGARVSVPDPGNEVSGSVFYKRFNTADEFAPIVLQREDGELVAILPPQPAAGKLEYFIVLSTPDGEVRAPARAEDTVIIRYKDPVPLWVLLPHVIMMFFAVMIGMRTGLGAMFAPNGTHRLAWITLVFMTVGGMILGPIVQKLAFGAFWTGFPLGFDLTDNKTLLMWIVWVAVVFLMATRWNERSIPGRMSVATAAIVMVIVYLIPHSLRGSELDYSKLDQGTPPAEAVESGG